MIEDLEEYDNQRDYSGLQAIEESLVGQKLDENQVQSKGVLNEEVSEGLEESIKKLIEVIESEDQNIPLTTKDTLLMPIV